MQIENKDLQNAAKVGLISETQAEQLWAFWKSTQVNTPQFQLFHVMYYFGGILAISAVTLFVTEAWETLQGLPLFIICAGLFALGFSLTHMFIKKNLLIPAGILATFSLAIVPLAIYNLQLWGGLSPIEHLAFREYPQLIKGYWVPMELGTLLVGVIMIYFYRFPFLLFPISITLFFLSMDLFRLFFTMGDYFWQNTFSLYFGLIVILVAIYIDFRNDDDRKDYAFWLYIFGVLTFWGGLSCQSSDSELSKFAYCMINFAMIIVSVFLNRRVFAVFGAIGILGYLGHLSFIFSNSLGFPIVLIFLGLLIIIVAARWSRMEKQLIEYCRPYIPNKILKRMQ